MSKILNIVRNMDKEQDRKQVTMTDKQIIINGVDVLKEKINMCFILLSHKLETSETIEQTIYEHLDAFVEEWNKQLQTKEQECDMWKNLTIDNGAVALKYQQQLDQLKAENEKLKQTLTEIKEIAKAESYLTSQSTRLLVHNILQKISECEVK